MRRKQPLKITFPQRQQMQRSDRSYCRGPGGVAQQRDLTPSILATMLQNTQRPALIEAATQAKKLQKIEATACVVAACEELAR